MIGGLMCIRRTVPCISLQTKQILMKLARSIASQSAAASQDIYSEPKWQLVAAACITRSPLVCPPLKPIEEKFKNLVEKQEIENSFKSNHELRLEEDKIKAGLQNVGDSDEVSAEDAAKQTGLEFEDASKEELQSFVFAPKITEADQSSDRSSLNRALDKALVLSVKQKLGSQHHRVFPQTPWIPGETLKQTCERVIKNTCGRKMRVKILGNAPSGHFKYKYPKEVRKEGYIGAKVFFFSAHVTAYDSEGLDENEDFSEFQWLTHEELRENISKSYFQAVSQFLISDD